MRDEDRRRSEQPYAEDQDPGERALAQALDVAPPQLDILADEILADFAVDPPYGVAWRAPHLGTSRRILITDQLYACVTSVSANLAFRNMLVHRGRRLVVSQLVPRLPAVAPGC